MDRWEREGLRTANHGMRNQLEYMVDALAEQRSKLSEAQEQLAAARFMVASTDGLVQVTVNGTGVLPSRRLGDVPSAHDDLMTPFCQACGQGTSGEAGAYDGDLHRESSISVSRE